MNKYLIIALTIFAINQNVSIDEHHGVRQRIVSSSQDAIESAYKDMYHRQIEALLNNAEIFKKETREAVHEKFKSRLADPEIAVNINEKELLQVMTHLAEGRITKFRAFLGIAISATVSAVLAALITFHTA